MTTETGNRREAGVDAMRFVGAGFVVLLHSLPAARTGFPQSAGMIDLASRFAVPFFFMASGYFLHGQQKPPLPAIGALIARIAPVYLFWLAFYLLAFEELRPDPHDARAVLVTLATGGSVFHLWFLPALLAASSLQLALRNCSSERFQASVAGGLLLLGLLLGSYRQALGLGTPGRAGLLLAYPLLMIGYFAASFRWRRTVGEAVAILVCGLVVETIESAALSRFDAGRFGTQNVLLGTVVFSYGAFQLALALPRTRMVTWLGACGRLSLGIYCCHLVFVQMAYRYWPPDSLAKTMAVAPAAFGLATATAFALFRLRLSKWLVS